MDTPLTVIESFCGAGGLALGLTCAGYDVRASFDFDKPAIETYRHNIGEHGFVGDAFRITGKELLGRARLRSGELDLFSGGPPCQGFSKQRRGAHLLEDPRNGLVLEFARLVRELHPKAFLFENVEVFGQKRGKQLVVELAERLSDYTIFTFYVCSSDFGLAQARGRFLMIGIRHDLPIEVPELELSQSRVTVRDVISDLPSPPQDCSEHPKIANHIKCKISSINELRLSHVPQGGGWKDIPYELRLPCHQKVDTSSGGWPDVYGRLSWDGVCPTITGGFDSFSRGRYGHPSENRAITPREAARLQGFPDDFRFMGTRADVRYQIGNAVPPPLGKIAGEAILRALSKQKLSRGKGQRPAETYNEILPLFA